MAVYDIGSATQTGGSSTTVVLTVGSTGSNYVGSARQLPAAGDVIAVWAGTNNVAGVSGVTDSKGNTYTQQVTNNTSAGNRVALFTATCGSAMTTSDTITITYGTTSGGKSAIAQGIQAAASPAATATNSNFNTGGTQPGSGTTGALTLPQVVLAAFGTASGGGAPSGFNFGGGDVTQVNPGGGMYLTAVYDLSPPAGGENAQCTLGTAAAWGAAVAALTIRTYTGTGGLAAKKAKLSGTGTAIPPTITGTGALAAKKARLSGTGTTAPPITGTGGLAAKKIHLAGTGTYTPQAITGTGALAAKKIKLAGSGTASAPGAITGTGGIAAKKIKLAGTGTFTPVSTPPITGTGGVTAKKITLAGSGLASPPDVAPPPSAPMDTVASVIPIYWGQLSLNDGDRPDGLCTVVTNVEGWYGSPPVVGNDLDRALTDGSVYGFKTTQARVVTVSGAVTGDRGLANVMARALAAQTVDRQPADLVIAEDNGDTEPQTTLTAQVRADSDSLTVAWNGRTYFTYQVALTAADPRLYEGVWRSIVLSPLAASTPTGRAYPWTPPRLYASGELANTARLDNPGSVPAPVLITYNGDLSESRLSDGTNTIHLTPVGAGVTIYVESETLNATAPGGATRASYLKAGSVPMLLPPNAETSWSLYGTGGGTVTLLWRGAWA